MSGQTIVATESSVELAKRFYISTPETPKSGTSGDDVIMNTLSRRLWTLEIHRRLEIKARDLLG